MSINTNYPNLRSSLLLDFANSQQLDPRVTFSRSTTAPYYDGKTSVLAEQNLLTNSQVFTNSSWFKYNSTITANSTTAPDGTTTSNLITLNASTGNHGIISYQTSGVITVPSGTYTISIYAYAGTSNFCSLGFETVSSTIWVAATFNLSTVAVTQTNNGSAGATYISSSITSVGSGWYRLTVTGSITGTEIQPVFTLNSSATPTYGANGLESWTAVGTETMYAWGFQLEQRSSVTAYNATTTSAITNYIPQLLTAPINAPRFDFNPTTGESLGFLIEQSSTNLLTYSQDFTNAVWTKSNATITATANIAPDGTQTAQLLVENTATSSHGFYFTTLGQTTGQTYTQSVYAKAKERTWIVMQPSAFNPTSLAYFNLGTGVAGSTSNCSSTITAVGNGWYRCTVTYTALSTGGIPSSAVFLATSDGGVSYLGNGYSGAYVWQNQIENLAFATSPIATTSAQVTRASDNASMTGTNFSSWYNNQQGTQYIESQPSQNAGALFGGLGAGATIGGSGYFLLSYATTNGMLYSVTGSSNIQISSGASALGLSNSFYKIAGSLQMNNTSAVVFNGTNSNYTTFTGQMPVVNQLYFGGTSFSNYVGFGGRIKKYAYYPIALTQAQLQALTGS